MAKDLKYIVGLKNAQLDAITTFLGAGGKLQLYDGAKPAGPGTAVTTQTKVAELTCGTPFAAAAAGGVLTANAITAADALATADAGGVSWFRLCDSAGNPAIDGTVGEAGDDCDCTVQNKNVNAGQNMSVTSLTINKAN